MRSLLLTVLILAAPVLAATIEIGADETPSSSPFCGD